MTHSASTVPAARRRRTFRAVRIGVLLAVLMIVLLYAWKDVSSRRARTEWSRTLHVALVVLRAGPVDGAAVDELRRRAPDLESRLAEQMRRYRGDGAIRPFDFTVYGPVDVTEAPPKPDSDALLDLGRHAWRSLRYFRDVDARAAVPSAGFDSRIYLIARPALDARRKTVEGESQQGGRVGQVDVELDATMVDFALFVATHELFHTLGATDAYDATGRALIPDGLADPNRVPLYPQLAAEVMARNVVLAPGVERPPEGLSELVVGPRTAREIGWLTAQ